MAILNRLKRDRAYWELVETTPQVLAKAEGIVLNHNVRALDAIHLASALIVRDSIGASLACVRADGWQLEAARQCGLETIAAAHSRRITATFV